MPDSPFVPDAFVPPRSLVTADFVLEPLGPPHNESDLAAWSSSIEHIRSTPSYPDGTWPPIEGMSLAENLSDLTRHAADFEARKGFTFTVLDPDDRHVIGCVYLYPPSRGFGDVSVQSWVSAERAELDAPLANAVAAWLTAAWPWREPDRYGRPAPATDERIVVGERIVKAPAARIFNLIADPAEQPRWDGNDNLTEAPQGQRVHAVGEAFTMLTSKGKTKVNHIVAFDEGRTIAWQTADLGHRPPGHIWRWDLVPIDSTTTRVIHTYDWTGVTDEARWPRHRQTSAANLVASIDRLAALAESQ